MKTNQAKSYKWAYLPFVFSSAAILATSVTAAPSASQQYQDAKQVKSINHKYVGGNTQLGVSVTDGGNIGLEINQVLSEDQNSSTSGGLWADYDLKGDDKGLQGRGVQINHNWVSRDRAGRATHVNKVTAAYDRNASGHAKATVGYGQENENLFWDVHASKGLTNGKNSRTVNGKTVSDKAYDYGVGAGVGTFLEDSNIRIRAGLDHEWGDDVGALESTARNTTLSAGIEKFFQGTPHSLGLDVAASKKSGGLNNGSNDTDINGKLTYRYDFGGASIYQPDRRYKRVRVEIPGRAVAPRYKSVATYSKKVVKKPYKQLIKSTVALEGQTFFKLNSAKLIPSAQSRLKQIATEIRRNGYKGSIRITGNTCGLGDPVYDQKLSEQRARAVRAFLIKNGFNANHLIARGLGKGHPKYPNTPDQGFKNRRVDVEYVSERKSYKTGYRTEVQNVRTGTKRVLISQGQPGTPRVIWRTEAIPTSPAWIKRAMHNNIRHDRNVSTYTSTDDAPVIPVNNAPTANNDTQDISCSTAPVTINVLGNDRDQDGDTLTITNVQPGQYGTTQIVNGQIVYTPNGTGCGKADSFEYTISDGKGGTAKATVTVNSVAANTAPTAMNDTETTPMNTPVTITALSNDTDPDGDTLVITGYTQGANGTVTKDANGNLVYTPKPGFFGTDSFTYSISDGKGGVDTATVTVTVPQGNTAPVANNDTSTTPMNTPVTITALSNDTDPDGDTLVITGYTQGANGTVTKDANGNLVYTPKPGFFGTDSFTYSISDGKGGVDTATVTVTVPQGNTAPVAVDDSVTTPFNTPVTLNTVANDSDADGDNLIITSVMQPAANVGSATISADKKTILFTPANGFTGTVSFDYTISDGKGGTATATETVTVEAPLNVAPIAQDDSATTTSGHAVTLTTLANDSDADGDTLTITNIQQPANGTAVISGNGQGIIYTPNTDFVGTETFTYTISDGNGHTATATETVIVSACNICTVANSDDFFITVDTATNLDVLSNDTGTGVQIVAVDNPDNGTAVITGNTINYTPNAGFTGTDTFWYAIKDAAGYETSAMIVVYVENP